MRKDHENGSCERILIRDREKEIQVHKDILISELKAAEEERHKVKVELQQRYNKVKNLRIKYEGLV